MEIHFPKSETASHWRSKTFITHLQTRLSPVLGSTNELSLSQVKLAANLCEILCCQSAGDSLEVLAAEVAAIKEFFLREKSLRIWWPRSSKIRGTANRGMKILSKETEFISH